MANFIENIEIQSFKSIRYQRIENCSRINLFIGYPNVGKSNLLEAIGLFSTLSLFDEKFDLNDICRVRHFSELFYNQDYKAEMGIVINDNLKLLIAPDPEYRLKFRITRLREDGHNNSLFEATLSKELKFTSYGQVLPYKYDDIASPIKKYEFKKDSIINRQASFSLQMPHGNNLLDVLQGEAELRKNVSELFETYRLRLAIDKSDLSIKYFEAINFL
jgi:AAA15 family ATPase/GTPase